MLGIHARFTLQRPNFCLNTNLQLSSNGITGIWGHSGSGKTTLLRCIAGLENCKNGFFSLNGEEWQNDSRFVPTHQRPIGYVFQESNLFPHLSVMANLKYGMKRVPVEQRRFCIDDIINLLKIDPLLQRKSATLSGGERQRVCVARALATSPKILLMDEPLAAIDRKHKREILPFFAEIHQKFAIPVLYVTHSAYETEILAHNIVVLEEGFVVAQGPLKQNMQWLHNND